MPLRDARPDPASDWITTEVDALRIIDQGLWDRVKARQATARESGADTASQYSKALRRHRYLFSGLTRRAACGGGYILIWRERLGCFNARARQTCDNRLTIGRTEVEQRVLKALRDKLMRPDLFEDFCREFTRETTRLRMEQRAGLSHARTELAKVDREIATFIAAIKDGVPGRTVRTEMIGPGC
jgi:site-specific DNA recombinase